ncbi:hypothetical protein C8J57DRAFT_1482358 [Mycena rebaudengoi]|nr:hypothetical protein C8J57DRAFT_1482358 [Mycena rebaudengoi]
MTSFLQAIQNEFKQQDPDLYPMTAEEQIAVATLYYGEGAAAEYHAVAAITEDGPWRVNSVAGYGSIFCADIHVAVVNAKYNIVFWGGGLGHESSHSWSFHISRHRPLTSPHTPDFHPRLDAPLELASEGLQVRVRCRVPGGYVVLNEGSLMAPEGHTAWLWYLAEGAVVEIPITFPMRSRATDIDRLPGSVLLSV